MQQNEEHEYHSKRAKAELDMAHRAERPEVATAHLRLSCLHMERARAAVTSAETLPRLGH